MLITGFGIKAIGLLPFLHYPLTMELGLTANDRERIRAYLKKSHLDCRPDDLLPTPQTTPIGKHLDWQGDAALFIFPIAALELRRSIC